MKIIINPQIPQGGLNKLSYSQKVSPGGLRGEFGAKNF